MWYLDFDEEVDNDEDPDEEDEVGCFVKVKKARWRRDTKVPSFWREPQQEGS